MARSAPAIRLRRSLLFMPGSNARALEKAKALPADALILDLEDAVAPEAKEEARRAVVRAVAQGGYGEREVAIRVNGAASPWAEPDLAAAAHSGAHAVVIPKVQSATDLAAVRRVLGEADAPPELALWAMIETPFGVLKAPEIGAAAAGNRYPCTLFIMGANDLARETRAQPTADRLPMLAWMSRCIVAARAYGLDVVDSVYNDVADLAGFVRECAQGRAIGFDGKTLIHPTQIEACNRAFAPSAEEVDWARKLIAAFDAAENRAKGAIMLDGRMVELMHRDAARRTLAMADAIAVRDGP